MTVAIVTTCMGRLEHLRRTLPSWVEHTPLPIYVVDYCCPDRTGDQVAEYAWWHGLEDRIFPIWFPPGSADRQRGRPLFNKCRAYNHAFGLTVENVLLLDADTLLYDGFWEHWQQFVRDDAFAFVAPHVSTRCLTGVLLAPLPVICRCGGFDEGMLGWGNEDLDLRLRLNVCQGLTSISVPPLGLLEPIDHDDSLRTKHYGTQDMKQSNWHNKVRMLENLRACRGWTYEQALVELKRPEIVKLLVTG